MSTPEVAVASRAIARTGSPPPPTKQHGPGYYRTENRRLRAELRKKKADLTRQREAEAAKERRESAGYLRGRSAAPKESAAAPKTLLRAQYQACEDVLFPGTWRAEPMNYTGHGCVYLFHGKTAQSVATKFAKEKNKEPRK